jgi:EmrB/QacA subfamily drug resistance transporter
VFLWGIVVFACASAACALSRSVGQLIAARAVQGVGAALLVPGSLALISMAFPEQERGRAYGTWAAFSGITSAVGPPLGGWLIEHVSWSWAFLINLPVAAVLVAIARWRVPESPHSNRLAGLDWWGALLATIGLGGVVFAFVEAPTRGWRSAEVLVALVCGVVALAAFLLVERKQASPMVPLQLFRDRSFTGANLLTLLLYAALGGGLFFLPLNLIQVQGLSATGAGAALLPFIAVMFLLSRWTGGLADTVGARRALVTGPAIAAVGFAMLTLPGIATPYWTGFLPALLVLGLGMAVAVAPLTATVMNSVGQAAAGAASGVNNAVSRMAGLLAIAIFGWVLALGFEPALQDAMQAAHVPAGLQADVWAQRARLAAIQVPQQAAHADAVAIRDAVRTAFVAGYRWVMGISAILALASSLVALATIPGPGREGAAARSPKA